LLCQLLSEPLASGGIFEGAALPFDIAALRGGFIENVIRRLDQARGL
jgi:hypothetical protein